MARCCAAAGLLGAAAARGRAAAAERSVQGAGVAAVRLCLVRVGVLSAE